MAPHRKHAARCVDSDPLGLQTEDVQHPSTAVSRPQRRVIFATTPSASPSRDHDSVLRSPSSHYSWSRKSAWGGRMPPRGQLADGGRDELDGRVGVDQ
jgi:hypothetical protein